MPAYDWSRFVLRLPVRADRQHLYDAWATAAGLERWFLRQAKFNRNDMTIPPQEQLQQNDRYDWWWHGWPDDITESGSVLEANGKDRFRFSFGKAGNVSVSIVTESGESMVVLEQEDIPVDEESRTYFHMGCMKGWLFYLTNLKSLMEGGIDLRNRNVGLKEVINS